MSFTTCLLVMVGGAIGSLARYALAVAALPISQSLPWGTIEINILGSFVIGAVRHADAGAMGAFRFPRKRGSWLSSECAEDSRPSRHSACKRSTSCAAARACERRSTSSSRSPYVSPPSRSVISVAHAFNGGAAQIVQSLDRRRRLVARGSSRQSAGASRPLKPKTSARPSAARSPKTPGYSKPPPFQIQSKAAHAVEADRRDNQHACAEQRGDRREQIEDQRQPPRRPSTAAVKTINASRRPQPCLLEELDQRRGEQCSFTQMWGMKNAPPAIRSTVTGSAQFIQPDIPPPMFGQTALADGSPRQTAEPMPAASASPRHARPCRRG